METIEAVAKALGITNLGWPGIFIVMFHPVWLTILIGLLLWGLLKLTGLWRRHKRLVLLGLASLYAIDTAIAVPRFVYAWRSPDGPVVHQKVALPPRLVLINVDCERECVARLVTGELEEVILVGHDVPRFGVDTSRPRRYRAGWSTPGSCPQERRMAISSNVLAFERDGFCPIIEATDVPDTGIFIVKENLDQGLREDPIPLKSAYLKDGPPGKVIRLRVVEVQRRTPDGVEVLAVQRSYEAPGLLLLPPLVGCWVGIDNFLGIYPPGANGCGFWRWFTWGGDRKWDGAVEWVYTNVFTP
jgi:hypothetical protein